MLFSTSEQRGKSVFLFPLLIETDNVLAGKAMKIFNSWNSKAKITENIEDVGYASSNHLLIDYGNLE